MLFMPFNIIGIWFRGLLSIAIVAGGLYLLSRWYEHSRAIEVMEERAVTAPRDADRPIDARPVANEVLVPTRRIFRFDPGWNRPTLELAAALVLLTWATAGRSIGNRFQMMFLRSGETDGTDLSALDSKKIRRRNAKLRKAMQSPLERDINPGEERTGTVHKIKRPDGSEVRVECYGPADAPPIIWTHGWGANSTEWFYQKRYLTDRFRLIVWDIPGTGLSKKPDDNDYCMENLAADLQVVLTIAGDRPAILVGHSIGGMITLTFCKMFAELLQSRIVGLVLAHTTYTNPVRTTQLAALYTAVEKPIIIPLIYLTIALWPIAWLMNWMSYFNGSAQRSTHKSSFAGTETRGQLDFCSRFMPHARPDVLARGMLGMIAYDVTSTLPGITVPTLVIVGDQDTTTPPEAGEFIAGHVPGAEVVTLSPAKHMGLIEHHDRFDRLVAEFAARCQTPITVS
jgi:pimeloyl-ACP methyl ester carboxylesterase